MEFAMDIVPPAVSKDVEEATKNALAWCLKDLSKLERNWDRDSLTLRHDISMAIATARMRLRLWLKKYDSVVAKPEYWTGKSTLQNEALEWAEDVLAKVADTTRGANAIDMISERLIMRIKAAIQKILTTGRATPDSMLKANLIVNMTLDAIKSSLGVEEAIVSATTDEAPVL